MAVREEARGLLLPTAIFARWSRLGPRRPRIAAPAANGAPAIRNSDDRRFEQQRAGRRSPAAAAAKISSGTASGSSSSPAKRAGAAAGPR